MNRSVFAMFCCPTGSQYSITDPCLTETGCATAHTGVSSINNTMIADKIDKEMRDAPRILQETFKKAVTLEAGLQLTGGIHLEDNLRS